MIAAHWLPNGDLRFFRQDAKMGGYRNSSAITFGILPQPS